MAKVVEKSDLQLDNDGLAIVRHNKRISNLNDELEGLESDLRTLESDLDIISKDKRDSSNVMIRRIVLIKYEVGVREELVKWLS